MSAYICPICDFKGPKASLHAIVDGYQYLTCPGCDSIHIEAKVLTDMDAGVALVGDYDDGYWEQERIGACERAEGLALCRAAEAILYCRRPVERFLDVGAGPGFLLKNLHDLLDPETRTFHGVEKFPPPYAITCPNFHIGDPGSLAGRLMFDAGVCIEVVEHLTPGMLANMVAGLASISRPGSFWLFNTGMPQYVREEDPGYLDPVGRGHVVSYSLQALQRMFGRHGFIVGALPGKCFGFYAEFQPVETPEFHVRIYHPLQENQDLIMRNGLLWQATLETARAYFYYEGYMQRTKWALSLDSELAECRAQIACADSLGSRGPVSSA